MSTVFAVSTSVKSLVAEHLSEDLVVSVAALGQQQGLEV